MQLPNAHLAQVDREKIVGYLLSEDQPPERRKAGYFSRFGFRVEQWDIFAEALRIHGASHEVAEIEDSDYGLRYLIDGILQTPDGRNPRVRTVWQIDRGYNHPRFITAHPLRR